MIKMIRRFLDNYPLIKYRKLEVEQRLSLIFLLVGQILSTLGVITSFIFGVPFWINAPNIFIMLLCFFYPIVFANRLLEKTELVVFFVGCVYFPFVFFTNGGVSGTGPLYFIMIVIYFAFFSRGKKLIISETLLLIFYTFIISLSYIFPELVIPYEDDLTATIDLVVAVISISITMTIFSYTTFSEFRKERSNSAALLMELENQNKVLENLTIQDQLTSTYSSSYFIKRLQEEINYAHENNESFYVMMIDLDHFKMVNDTYGHLYGDEVLIKVADKIRSCLREHDLVARYGGEEFAVLISHLTPEEGVMVAERIRKSVEVIQNRYNHKITISIGVSKNRVNDQYLDIIKRADDLLYKAKNNGRNRVEN